MLAHPMPIGCKSSQVNNLPKAKSQAKDKRAKDRQSVVVVAVNGVEAKALVKSFGFDVVADGVSHGDTAH